MSWPVDNAVHMLTSLTDWLQDRIQITSQLHIMAPQTNIEPMLVVEFGGANGYSIEKSQFNWTEQNNPTKPFPDQAYDAGQWVDIPIVISLELSDTQGEVFAGRVMLATMSAARFLYSGAMINIPISSINSTYTSVATGEPVNFVMGGLNARLMINEVDSGVAIKYDEPDDNGGMDFKFIQTFSGTYSFKVSNRIYKDMRLNNAN